MTLDKDKDYRHKNIVFALYELRPNAKWSFNGEGYGGLDWKDDTQTKPTETELFAKVTELENAEPMRLLRVERNRLLAETDWVSTKSIDTGVGISTDWKTYRQSLRDLPSTQTPVLDHNSSVGISSVTWPTKPS